MSRFLDHANRVVSCHAHFVFYDWAGGSTLPRVEASGVRFFNILEGLRGHLLA